MNKNRYRIVFNKVRNLMMAVAENTTSQGKGQQSGSDQPSVHEAQRSAKQIQLFQLKPLAFVALCMFGLQPVLLQAAVVADPNAPSSNKPLIDVTANSLPLVQITTPSAAGVSRNQYSQFNVDPSGVILNNNSQGFVQTQQGGLVGSNPYLGNGSARIILNEVTGTGASSLRGYTEVAGQRAEVIIANPNGIVCDGCGFINTSRGILTTGVPVMGSGGSLDSFRVTGGQITIGTGGLNASNVDQLDLITRSLQVNGEIWANNLNAVVGANQVDYNTLGVQVIAGDASKPTGIDVALLGGMYANKIHLVGTEAGVGVNSRGNMAAQAGSFTLDNRGNITLSGRTSSSTNMAISTQGDLANNGTLEGNTVNTKSSAFNNTGTVQTDALTLTSSSLNNQGVDAKINATTSANLLVAGDINNAGSLAASNFITVSQGFNNTGLVEAEVLTLNAASINNQGVNAKITANSMAKLTTTGNIDNTGSISGGEDGIVTTNSIKFNNSGAVSASVLNINADSLNNQTALSKITGNTSANLDISGNIDNAGTITATRLTSKRSDTLKRGGAFNNSGSVLGDVIEIKASSLNNLSSSAKISANTSVDLDVNGDVNNVGSIEGDDVKIHNTQKFTNTGAVLGKDVVINAVNLDNNGATAIIAATHSIDLMISNAVSNTDGATIYSIGDLNVAADKTTYSASFTNSSGTVQADGVLRISANLISNKRTNFDPENYIQFSDWVTNNNVINGTDIDGYTIHYKLYTRLETIIDNSFPLAAKLLSGSDMRLNGSIVNEYSTVAAGGSMYINNTIANVSDIPANSNTFGFKQVSRSLVAEEKRIGTKEVPYAVWVETCAINSWGIKYNCSSNQEGRIRIDQYESLALSTPTDTHTFGSGFIAGGDISLIALSLSNLNVGTASTTLGIVKQDAALVASTTTKLLNITLPTNSLFHYNTAPNPAYLIETNPRFANYRDFLSSAYMLSRLTFDPQQIHKRLGDGFYEQKLVTDQITGLTGRKFLPQYASAEEEFKALMDQGLAEAHTQNLVAGVALTTAQVAALTHDIVWMVAQEVNLPNGTKEKLLVPQVFLTRIHANDLRPNGSLIAAENIDIKTSGTLLNSGTILGSKNNSLSAADVVNKGGTIGSGGDTVIVASNDIKNLSGTINGGRVAVLAGHDVVNDTELEDVKLGNVMTTRIYNMASIEATENINISAGHDVTNAGANVVSGGNASIVAGNNFAVSVREARQVTNFADASDEAASNSDGTPNLSYALGQFSRGGYGQTGSVDTKINLVSNIKSGGNLTLTANNDINLTAAQISVKKDLSVTGTNINLDAAKDVSQFSLNDHRSFNTSSYDEKVIGSTLQAGGNVLLAASRKKTGDAESAAEQGNVTLKGAVINSTKGSITLAADTDVKIGTVDEKHEFFSETQSHTSGVFASTDRTERKQTWRTDAIGSNLSGDNIHITSGHDINVEGSNIVAKKDISLGAMNDVNITAATNTYGSEQYSHEQTSGWQITSDFNITNKGPEVTRKAREEGTKQSYSRSSLTSGGGNLNIMAGGNLIAAGTDLSAKTGDLALTAGGTVALLAGQDTLSKESSSLTVTNTNLISQQRRTITDSFNSLEYQGSTAQGKKITVSSGADIVLQAGQITAGAGGITLDAGNDIKLLAAMNSTSSKHTEKLETDGVLFGAAGNLDAFSDRSKDSKTEKQHQTAKVSQLMSAADISTHSAHNTLIEASALDAKGAIDLSAGNEATYKHDGSIKTPGTEGKLTFAAVKDTDYFAEEDKHTSRVWQSQSGSGHYTETVKLASIKAGKGLSVNATGGIVVDITNVPAPAPVATAQPEPDAAEASYDEHGNLQAKPKLTPEQEAAKAEKAAIKAAAAAAQKKIDDENRFNDHINNLAKQPGQEWIGQLSKLAKEKPSSVKIQQVSAAAQHWDYKSEGLTPEAAAVVVIAVTYFSAGAASGAAGAITGAATTTVASAAIAAGITTLASQTAVSFLNNKGDAGKTMTDMGKSENVKALVTAMVTAGVLQGLSSTEFMQSYGSVSAKSTFSVQLQKNVINNLTSATVNHAINGGDLEQQLVQSLRSAFIDTGAAQGANWIGDMKQDGTLNTFTHKLAHAIAGCAAGMAKSDDCRSGALGAVVGEITAEMYAPDTQGGQLTAEQKADTIGVAKIMAGVAAAVTGNDVNLASAAGGNAAENNFLAHPLQERRTVLRKKLEYGNATTADANELKVLEAADQKSDELFWKWKANPDSLSENERVALAGYLNVYGKIEGKQKFDQLMGPSAMMSGAFSAYGFPYAGSQAAKDAYLTEHPTNFWSGRNVSGEENAYYQAQGLIRINEVHQGQAAVGTPALYALPGPIGMLANLTMVAGGGYQVGQGLGAAWDGQYIDAAKDMGLGSLAIFGGGVGLKISMGRSSGVFESELVKSNPLVKVDASKIVKGSPEYDMVNNLKPNTSYELSNGNTFNTNKFGLVDELSFTPNDTKIARDSRQTDAGKLGKETDVGGHAQACSQGGSCDAYNLFAQDKNFNNSAYKVFYENVIKKALNDPDLTVGSTTIKFDRINPSSVRPDSLSVKYTINGETSTVRFKNEPNQLPEIK